MEHVFVTPCVLNFDPVLNPRANSKYLLGHGAYLSPRLILIMLFYRLNCLNVFPIYYFLQPNGCVLVSLQFLPHGCTHFFKIEVKLRVKHVDLQRSILTKCTTAFCCPEINRQKGMHLLSLLYHLLYHLYAIFIHLQM